MSKIVEFLESLGGNASASRLSDQGYAEAVEALDVGAEARAALLARDAMALNRCLKGRTTMVFALVPAENDEPQEEEGEDESEASVRAVRAA